MLSVLAPCVISIIPILLARSSDGTRTRSPFFIIGGLLGSIFIFTLLLKSSTLLISVPPQFWQVVSGSIIVLFGLISLFPNAWETISAKLKLQSKAQQQSGKALQRKGKLGDLLLGASLGPVFSACSPTYALIVASILPVTPLTGLLYLVVFLIGLGGMLTLIAVMGSRVVKKLGWGINPEGWFKRILGIIFIIIGIAVLTGLDKTILSSAVENGLFDWQLNLETQLQR
jgi:cytochrome c biogenesis protein CcdA